MIQIQHQDLTVSEIHFSFIIVEAIFLRNLAFNTQQIFLGKKSSCRILRVTYAYLQCVDVNNISYSLYI